MTLDDKLKAEMGRVASMNNILRSYEQFSLSEKASVLEPYTHMVANDEKDIPDISMELEKSDDVARVKKMGGFLANRVEGIKPDYEANKTEITAELVTRLNSDIGDTSNLLDAVSKVAYAFAPLIKPEKLTQAEADRVKATDLSSRYGVRFTHVSGADIKEYSQQHFSLQLRTIVAEYLKEEDAGAGKKKYSVDEEKLKDLMENPLVGSTLYTAKKPKKEE